METREAVFKALDEGKKLTSKVTGIQYKLIDGSLHSKNGERNDWNPSGLTFDNPPSWLNLQE
jgi:hypothetical protein